MPLPRANAFVTIVASVGTTMSAPTIPTNANTMIVNARLRSIPFSRRPC